MSRLSVEALEKSLARLDEGFADAARYPDLLIVRDGVIQRFEIAMDLSWKMMQRVLKEIYQVDEGVLLSKKDIFRQAAKHRLLDDTETWLGHYEARNKTSHSNSISKVKQGGDERTTKTVHSVRLGVSEETNAVSPMKWNWNHIYGNEEANRAFERARAFLSDAKITLERLRHAA